MASPWQVDLSSNFIGGYYENDVYDSDDSDDEKTKFVSEPSGVRAIADAIVRTSLTQLSIGDNPLGDDGFRVLLEGCKASSSLATLDLGNKTDWVEGRGFHLGVKGAQMAADLLRVSPSLTSINLRLNDIGEGKALLRKAVEGRSGFELRL